MDIAILIITLGSFAASFVNAAFATGGVYITLLTSAAVLPLSAAIPLQSLFLAASLSARVYLFWDSIKWHIFRMFALGSLVGVSFGILAFTRTPDNTLSILLGIVFLILIWTPPLKNSRPIKGLFFYVGILHSFLGAMFGVGGVLQPIVLRTKMNKEEITGTLAASMLVLDVFKVSSYIGIGFNYLDFIPHIIGATLAGFAGSYVGKRVSHHISETLFRRVFRIFVSIVALRLIYAGLFA